jgi:hypothetical protein
VEYRLQNDIPRFLQNLFIIVAEMDEERVTKLTIFVSPVSEDEEEE